MVTDPNHSPALSRAEKMALKAATRRDIAEAGGQQAATYIEGMRWLRHQSFNEAGDRNFEAKWLPIDILAVLARELGQSHVLQTLCSLAGGVFVPLPRGASHRDIEIATGKTAKECGEAMVRVGEALADKKITANEKAEMVKELDDLVVAALGAIEVIKQAQTDGDEE